MYARHFDLLKDVIFGASVHRVTRDVDNAIWQLEYRVSDEVKMEEFDKVVFCHGYQNKPNMPTFEGSELFAGQLIHGQQFRTYVILQDFILL